MSLVGPGWSCGLTGIDTIMQMIFNRLQVDCASVQTISGDIQLRTFANSDQSIVSYTFTIKSTNFLDLPLDFDIANLNEEKIDTSGNIDLISDFKTQMRTAGNNSPCSEAEISFKNTENSDQPSKKTNHGDAALDYFHTRSVSECKYDTSVTDVVNRAPLLAQPVDILITGMSTMYLNGDNQIVKIVSTMNLIQS